MNKMVKPFLMGAALLCAASVAMASVSFLPYRDRYPRGTVITIAAHVSRANDLVCFYERDSKYTSHLIGIAYSDANCNAYLRNFVVPTDPNRDNCYIKALDSQGAFQGETRIPIGL